MAQSVKPADAGVSVGQVFQGKYRVDSILGHGGMGVVAECTHLHLNERVAIKMLRQDVLLDQDAVSRFIREAQAAVKLKSEYVARVSDVGTFENGVPYMVMEFLEGYDLGELLKQRGVLPVQWAVELMLQTAEALAEAHSLAIVHRDVKPTNLFVTWRPDGSSLVKVLDFGISKSPLGTDMQLTQTQSLLGTPAYMSPEQMRSARLVDTRTDIWSLGTVFYEILEGRRPFEAESFSEMCVKVAVDPPAPMINTPPGLQQVIMRCLAKSPEQRYANMAELGRDLVPYSADPHGAQMLVERMARMLKRGVESWEGGGTGSGGQRVLGARDLGSGPVRTTAPAPQQWGVGSDPAANPWHAKSDPSAQPWNVKSDPSARPWQAPRGDASQPFARPVPAGALTQEGSQPFARPLSDDSSAGFAGPTLSTKKPRWPIVLLMLFVFGGTAAGVALYMTGGQSAQPAAAPTEDPGTTLPMSATPAAPAPAVAPAQDPPPPTVPALPTDVTKPELKADKVEGAAAPTVSKTEAEPKKGTAKAGTTKGVAKGTVKAGTTKSTLKGSNALADPNAGEPPPKKEEPKKEEPRCDPFQSMHGCSSK